MKRNSLVLGGIILFLGLVHRDVSGQVNLDLGVKCGLSLTALTYLETDWSNLNRPFIKGAFLAVNLSERFAIQTELCFRTLGYVSEADIAEDHYRQVWSFRYISVPILAKFKLKSRGIARPVILGGLAGNVAISERMREYLNGTLIFEFTEPRPSAMNFTSFMFGAGVEFSLVKLLFGLDIRYEILFPWQNVIFDRCKGLIITAGVGF